MSLKKYVSKEPYKLESQFRMKSGNEYIKLIEDFLQINSKNSENNKYNLSKYDLNLYDSLENLYEKILKNNNDLVYGKSRLTATISYAPWITKNIFVNLSKSKDINYKYIKTDFNIGKYKLVWNKSAHYQDWLEKSDVSEVGSVHTVQGKDLYYSGVVFSKNDISFLNGNIIASEEIKHQYFILMTRGIIGTGLYIEDENLKYRFNEFTKKIS